MFLDDELLQMCEQSEADTPEKLQQLNRDIFVKCHDYFINTSHSSMTAKEIKAVINTTFNIFDSFVRMAKKSDSKKVRILGKMFEKHTFKKQFLRNNKVAKIYFNL